MSDLDLLHDLCAKTYKEQAIWFLNCFWESCGEANAERVWNYVLKCNELDDQQHASGCGLDELKAHVFLESFQETLTVREMREKLRSTGAIGEKERPKTVPITHYLLFKFEVDWHTLVDASRQGSNKEELEKAERLLAQVQAAFKESERAASIARVKLVEAQNEEAAAKRQEEQAHKDAEIAKEREAKATADATAAASREEELKAAQRELEAALAEVKAQEDAYNAKTADLTRKSEEGGVVSRNKAKNELAQHLAEDPLPLRRAKITAEAAVKKAEKAATAAEEARKQAESSKAAATAARQEAVASANAATEAARKAEAAARESEAASAAAEKALADATRELDEAQAYLDEIKSKPGQSFGALWWIDRELYEQRKYLPESKGGIRK